MEIESGGGAYNFGFDNVPFNDPASADSGIFRRVLPTNVTLSSTADIIFDSRGYLVDVDGDLTSATLTISFDSSSFCSGTLEATGNLELDCNG